MNYRGQPSDNDGGTVRQGRAHRSPFEGHLK